MTKANQFTDFGPMGTSKLWKRQAMYDEATLKPLGNRVIVRVEPKDEYQTDAGVTVLPSYAPEAVGRVVFCGANPDVSVGDVVIFPPSAGQKLIWDGEPHVVVALGEILATYDGVTMYE